MGRREGDGVRHGYHGLVFNGPGRCAYAPCDLGVRAARRPPPGRRVPATSDAIRAVTANSVRQEPSSPTALRRSSPAPVPIYAI